MALIAAWLFARTRLLSISCGYKISRGFQDVKVPYLVHKSKDDLFISHEAFGKLAPEFSKLGGCGSGQIGRVSNDTSRVWLLMWVVVSHIIVRVQNTIRPFGDGNVIDCVGKFGKVLNN
jgi:hypothetical protein